MMIKTPYQNLTVKIKQGLKEKFLNKQKWLKINYLSTHCKKL